MSQSKNECCPASEIPKRLTGVEVVRMPSGERIACESLWKEQPVLLCMFRRWGCGICRMSAANISAMGPLLASKGVKLVGFGIERLGFEKFVKRGFFNGELFVDEDKKAYSALELRESSWRNLWGIFDEEVVKYFKLSQSKGFENNLKGNANQLGGTFLIMPDGSVPYAHFQSKESFEPDLFKILEVLDIEPPTDYEFYPAFSGKTCSSDNTSHSSLGTLDRYEAMGRMTILSGVGLM